MDLVVIALLTLLLQLFVYSAAAEPPRIALGLILVLFSPGYVFVSALYPRRAQLTSTERIALGIGLSLALVPLLGLALNFTPWGIRLTSILWTLTIWTLLLAAVAWHQRRRVAASDRFDVPWESVRAWFRNSRRPADLALALILTLAALAVVGAFAWKIQQPTPGESFTEFSVLGSNGKLQDYPTSLRLGETQKYNVGIVNHERGPVSYSVRAFLGGTEAGSVGPLALDDGGRWDGNINVTPETAGAFQKLELRLFREPENEVYLTVYLFIDVFPP